MKKYKFNQIKKLYSSTCIDRVQPQQENVGKLFENNISEQNMIVPLNNNLFFSRLFESLQTQHFFICVKYAFILENYIDDQSIKLVNHNDFQRLKFYFFISTFTNFIIFNTSQNKIHK